MNDDPSKKTPPAKPAQPSGADARKQRLSVALRDNLRRRKVQDRERSQELPPRPVAEKGTD